MNIGGVQWTSTVDFPGKISVTVFTIGCDFRCPFCHNPELAEPAGQTLRETIAEEVVLGELEERAGFHDAVVLTGGEPTLQPDLSAFLEKVRTLGFSIKLDTNGHRPESVRSLLEKDLVDYVAMDVKAPRTCYGRLAGASVDLDRIDETIELLMKRAPDYEFRTTVAPPLTVPDVISIGHWIRGARRYFLQAFRAAPGKPLLNPEWQTKPSLDKETLEAAWEQLRAMGFEGGGVRA